MEEKNELNDIILNKNSSSAGNKRIILAVATLGIVLIVVVMLMNTLTSSNTDNLPQAILPPEPQKEIKSLADEPLFEDVPVVQETNKENISLDEIAQKLKEESTKEAPKAQTQEEKQVETTEIAKVEPKNIEPKRVTQKEPKSKPQAVASGGYYIQVGSFSRYEPNKKFLESITKLGYEYKFHKVPNNATPLNKVLVGPFSSESEARKALKSIRASVESGAFLTKI
jgi:DedD protein